FALGVICSGGVILIAVHPNKSATKTAEVKEAPSTNVATQAVAGPVAIAAPVDGVVSPQESGRGRVHLPASVMMGADPSQEFIPGPAALKGVKLTNLANIPSEKAGKAAKKEGLIELDPICETIE